MPIPGCVAPPSTTAGREELRTVLEFLCKVTCSWSPASTVWRAASAPAGHRLHGAGPEGDRAADRHQHRRRQVLPGHAEQRDARWVTARAVCRRQAA